MDGVVVVDKPAGMGSTDVVRVVRRISDQRRVGHTGTLDPDATGVLVVCLGRATRLVRFLQAGRKTYLAEMVLGRETTTQDASGEVVAERSAAGVTEPKLCDVLARFVGEIEQVPPMVSAVRVDGERLYEKARRGEEVAREARTVTVDEIILESFEPASEASGDVATAAFLVTCSSGTYVRTLAHDVGRELGCGASLTALRRCANGAFTADDAHPLDEIEAHGQDGTLADIVLSMAEGTRGMPHVRVDRDAALDVAHGRTLPPQDIDEPFAVLHDNRLLAVYRDQEGRARAEAVLVQPDDLDGS